MYYDVHITFPLYDDDDDDTTNTKNSVASTRSTSRIYHDVIHWDIRTMPAPMEYAMHIGEEFGLYWHDVLMLEEDIRQQLQQYEDQQFTNLHKSYCVTLLDATGAKRRKYAKGISCNSSNRSSSRQDNFQPIHSVIHRNQNSFTSDSMAHESSIIRKGTRDGDKEGGTITITIPIASKPVSSDENMLSTKSSKTLSSSSSVAPTSSVASHQDSTIPISSHLLPYEYPNNNNYCSYTRASIHPTGTTDTAPPQHVQYCISCLRQESNLNTIMLCCSSCPRSYHTTCVSAQTHSMVEGDTKWQCGPCTTKQIPELIPYDTIPGATSLRDSNITQFSSIYVLLYRIVHTLQHHTHFGHIFSHPINNTKVPNYTKVVPHPMDYSTVLQYLTHTYRSTASTSNADSDDVMLRTTLTSICLIFHNCFLYNAPNTVVYRMGQVQQWYFQQYCIRFLQEHDHQLQNLKEYQKELKCRRDKAMILRCADRLPLDIHISPEVHICLPSSNNTLNKDANMNVGMDEDSSSDFTPGTDNTTSVSLPYILPSTQSASTAGSKGSSIVLLNPHTNEIVRYYSTQKIAYQAALYLHREHSISSASASASLDVLSEYQWRKYIRSKQYQSTLFGYYWVPYEDMLTSSYVPLQCQDRRKHSRRVYSGNSQFHYTSNRTRSNSDSYNNTVSIDTSGKCISNGRRVRTIQIPRPLSHHCHAYLTYKHSYCRRKLVQGYNYCGLHLSHASSSSSSTKHSGSGGCIHVSPVTMGSDAEIERTQKIIRNNKDGVKDRSAKESKLTINVNKKDASLHDSIEDIVKDSAKYNPLQPSSVLDDCTNICRNGSTTTPDNVTHNNRNCVQVATEVIGMANARETNVSTETAVVNCKLVIPTPITAISLDAQTVLNRYSSLHDAALHTGMHVRVLQNIIRSQVPVGDVFYSEARHEEGVMNKIKSLVQKGKQFVGSDLYEDIRY